MKTVSRFALSLGFAAIAVGALATMPVAHAQVAPSTKVVKDFPVSFNPSYFFKVSGDGKYLVFTLFRNDDNTGEQNYMLDISGTVGDRKAKPIPGDFDPMFNQDDATMTMPMENDGDYICAFYSQQDVMAKGRDAGPLYVDSTMRCVYQSVGLLSSDAKKSRFRLILESNDGFSMKDYERDKQTNVVTAMTDVIPLCKGWNLKLPMVSKTGREMGAFDMARKSSVLLKIDDNGTCHLDTDLKAVAGKISFSYDGKRVAYHVFSTSDQTLVTDFVEVPSSDYTADIYVYNRDTKTKQQITHNKASNSMFPEFLKNGDVIYVDHPNDDDKKVHFVEVTPN